MVLNYIFTVKLNIYLMGYEPTMRIPVLWAYRQLDAQWWVYILLNAHWPSIRYKLSDNIDMTYVKVKINFQT